MSVYVTDDNISTEKKAIFFTSVEWESLLDLARDCELPIGCLIVKLAHEHRRRINSLGYIPD